MDYFVADFSIEPGTIVPGLMRFAGFNINGLTFSTVLVKYILVRWDVGASTRKGYNPGSDISYAP
jgi:hypothetical protein